MTQAAQVTNTPADILAYQNELVRTGKYTPLGRMKKIAVGPSGAAPPPADNFMRKFGRFIDFRERSLPIAQSLDGSMALITSRWIWTDKSVAALPDVPDPLWKPPSWTRDEVTQKVDRDPAKDRPPMIAQRLRDRADGYLENSQTLVIQPVLSIVFQPELGERMQPTFWMLVCRPDVNGKQMALLVDERTGQTNFYAGDFEIIREGEFSAGRE